MITHNLSLLVVVVVVVVYCCVSGGVTWTPFDCNVTKLDQSKCLSYHLESRPLKHVINRHSLVCLQLGVVFFCSNL